MVNCGMDYTKLTGDVNISRITLGTWAIGGSNWGEYDEGDAIKAIETAIDNGINIIDTAPAYGNGHSERLIGNIIRGRRDKIIVATKCGLDIDKNYINNLSPEFMEYELTQSLERLQTDYIDIYQCHWPDPNTPIENTMKALMKFKREGRVRYIGVANFSSEEIKESLRYAEISTVQSHYSLLERSIESDLLDRCIENGIAVLSYGSLGGGMLTGKYSERPRFRGDDARSFFYGFFQEKYWFRVKDLVDKLVDIARDRNAKPSQIAISWMLSRRGITSAIVGARNPEQIIENIGGTDITLSAEEIEAMDILSAAVYQ
jgi:methylglyoxal reductase